MGVYHIVDAKNNIVNKVVWDGISEFKIDDGHQLVLYEEPLVPKKEPIKQIQVSMYKSGKGPLTSKGGPLVIED